MPQKVKSELSLQGEAGVSPSAREAGEMGKRTPAQTDCLQEDVKVRHTRLLVGKEGRGKNEVGRPCLKGDAGGEIDEEQSIESLG